MLQRAHWAMVSLLLAGACVTKQSGRVYSMQDGKTSMLVIDDAETKTGSMHGTLPTGQRCQGSFNKMPVSEIRAFADPEVPITDKSSAAMGVLACTDGVKLRCTLSGRRGYGFSYGICRDERGAEYSLMF